MHFAALTLVLAPLFLPHGPGPTPATVRATVRAAHDEPTQQGPNIVLLFADDQRADSIGAWGNRHVTTPHLDRLTARGTSFLRAYNLGSPHGAVCMPSRAMLHTGRPYHGMNLTTFDGAPTLGSKLEDAGYTTFATGKWHNGPETLLRSFSAGRAVFLGGMCDHNRVPLVDIAQREVVNKRVGEAHSSELFADAAVEFLEGYEEPAPFFLYVAFTAPHDPRDPPARWLERAAEERPPLPRNFRGQHGFDNGQLTVRDEQLAAWPRTPEVVREQLREYYALIAHLDEQVGRVLAALEARDDGGETLIVYAADHGLALGSHGLLGKQSLYEHSIRTPVIVAGPGVPEGGRSTALVYLHDLHATLLGQAGLVAESSRLGADLAPLWRGERESVRDTLFTSMTRHQRAVTDGHWKLIRYPEIDRTQLFDLASDPSELFDLASEPAQAARIRGLRAALEDWQSAVGDDVTWDVPDPAPASVDLTDHSRGPDRWQPEWIREKYFRE